MLLGVYFVVAIVYAYRAHEEEFHGVAREACFCDDVQCCGPFPNSSQHDLESLIVH